VSFELAEHVTGDALTPAEIRVLRLIADGNANKEMLRDSDQRRDRQEPGQEHSVEAGAKDRQHAAMIGSSAESSKPSHSKE